MVDKLDIAIPHSVGFRTAFAQKLEEMRSAKDSPIRTGSSHYAWTADLRPFGHSAIIHMGNKHQRHGDHKIELIDTAELGEKGLRNEVQEIFEIRDSVLDDRRIMRLDLAADISHVPVTWFKERVRVDFKRRHREEGKADCTEEFPYVEDGMKRVQTLYYGNKPNQFRIYDKHDELKYQYSRLRRGFVRDLKNNAIREWLQANSDAELPENFSVMMRKKVRDLIKSGKQFPSFEDVMQMPEKGITLTRFERQIGGGRFPEKIKTLRDLKNLPDFNPFNVVTVMHREITRRPDPTIYDGNGKMRRMQTHFTGLYLKHQFEEYGMQRVMDLINHFPSRQAKKKLLTVYRDYLPVAPARDFHGFDERTGITSAQLFDLYRDSVSRQLAA